MKYFFNILAAFLLLVSCSQDKELPHQSDAGRSEAPSFWQQPFAFWNTSGTSKQKCYPGEYVTWVTNPENGLVKRKPLGDIYFEAFYKPHAYEVIRQNGTRLSKESCREKARNISDLQYFTLKIGLQQPSEGDVLKHKLKSGSAYKARLDYFANRFNQDIALEIDGQSWPCKLHHFERTFGLRPYITFVLGFENPDDQAAHDKVLILNDQVFGKGRVKLRIRQEDIAKIPELKFYKSS